ncbi:MAG: UDP-3-O-(3-hydroxymyristoyl)glucosamine N-acyltransferase [Eubacteriales bacterium]
MLLSSILQKEQICADFYIENEKPFIYLALTESTINEPNCVFLDNEKYLHKINDSVTMVLTTKELQPLLSGKTYGLCVVKNPRELFFELHNSLAENNEYKRKQFKTKVGKNCIINTLTSIAEYNVIIGDNVIIEEFAVIRENTFIGDNTIIRAGAKIGSQGFEFKHTNNCIMSVVHLGGVIIGENVEIQYNTCIDRAVYPWDNTEIGNYSKIDNLVHIGHAVKIKKNVMIVANSGLGGRTIVNDNTWIGFAATIINGISIGENARANIGSVVTKSVPDNCSVTGNFAIEHNKFIRNLKKANED